MHRALYKPLSSPDVVAYVVADVAIILIAARIVGALFEKVRQPRIVGEIVAGILIGPTVLGGSLDIPADPAKHMVALAGTGLTHQLYPLQAFSFLNALGSIALIFYMFLVGLELDKRLLKGKATQMTIVAFSVIAVPVAMGFLAGSLLGSATWRPAGVSATTFALFLGAGISVTAFPVMARILQEKGMLASSMGAIGVGSAAIVTVLMFLVIAAASASAHGAGIVGDVGVRFALMTGLIALLVLVVRPLMGLLLRGYREGEPLGGDAIAAMLVGALLTGLAADRIIGAGLVGGFLFGAAIPAKPGLAAAAVARLQDAVILFFLPVFLAVSGLRTDLTLIRPNLLGGILLFIALMIAGKWLVGYVAGRATGLSGRDANAIGVLLNCRGLLILVVALIGLELNVITPQMQLVFVLGAIVSTMMTGPLMDLIYPKEEVRRATATLTVEELAEGARRESSTAVFGA